MEKIPYSVNNGIWPFTYPPLTFYLSIFLKITQTCILDVTCATVATIYLLCHHLGGEKLCKSVIFTYFTWSFLQSHLVKKFSSILNQYTMSLYMPCQNFLHFARTKKFTFLTKICTVLLITFCEITAKRNIHEVYYRPAYTFFCYFTSIKYHSRGKNKMFMF